ncbi:MAG: glycosyltransferase family 2 protein [Hyphomicrobiaceae bacterium]
MYEAMPQVSVVVPCYNGGKFVPALLEALAAQTVRDFETIIVDDGSTDPLTQNVLATLPDSIRVVRQANAGLPGARNTGFAAARAPFVLPLDCDDAILPTFLETGLAMLAAAPSPRCFVYSDLVLHGARTGALRRRFNRFDQLFLNQLPYALLMPRGAWAEVGGYDATMRDGYEDWEFNLRLVKAGYRGLRLPEPLFHYYVRPDGMHLSHSALRHGKIWRYIRGKHADAYELGAVLSAWRDQTADPARVPAWLAMMLLAAARTLPDKLFSHLYRLMLLARARQQA